MSGQRVGLFIQECLYWQIVLATSRLSLLQQQLGVKRRGNGCGGVELVQVLDALVHIVLYGRQGGHDGGGPEAVGDHGEVGEGSLDAGVEDGLGPRVAQGGPVLVQQVHQLLADHPVTMIGSVSFKSGGRSLIKIRFEWEVYI